MHDLTIKIYTLGIDGGTTTELADISGIALDKSLDRRLNARSQFTLTCPAGSSLLTATAGDGFPNLRRGRRKLVVWEDGDVIFHGRIWLVERTGDGKQNLVAITAFDAWMELGFDSEDRAGRYVRGSTSQPTAGSPFGEYDGNFINPKFASSVAAQDEVSGPDLIKQALRNSQQDGDEGDASPGEGELPIDLTGTFDLNVPPAIDLTPSKAMSWPSPIGDFITQIVQTGVTDFVLTPLEPGAGTTDYKMVEASAVSTLGTDRSGTVHFDYFTGSHNAAAARHVEDFSKINNKLYDYLGPRLDQSHWLTNITPSHPAVDDTIDVDGSRDDYGTFMQIRAVDSFGDESSNRPLFIALWNAEQRYRVEPGDRLYITPAPDAKALFEPPADFDIGDLIAVNTGADFGVALAATQRVHGYTRTWDRQGVARVSELVTSADPA